MRGAFASCRRVFGNGHVGTLGSISNLGMLPYSQGGRADAEAFRETIEGRQCVLGDDPP